MERKNIFFKLFGGIGDVVSSIFKPKIKELEPYTEADFDNDLEKVLQKDKYEELEYIGLIKQGNFPKDLEAHLIGRLKDRDFHVNRTDKNGDTLLHAAVQQPNMENLIVALINNGADLTKKNNGLNTPVDLAQNPFHREVLNNVGRKMEQRSQNISQYIRRAIEDESILPISDEDLDAKFPPVVLRIKDLTEERAVKEVKSKGTILDGIGPYLDEDIQDDEYVPGISEHIHRVNTGIDELKKLCNMQEKPSEQPATQIQKITDQKKIPVQDTSHRAREV